MKAARRSAPWRPLVQRGRSRHCTHLQLLAVQLQVFHGEARRSLVLLVRDGRPRPEGALAPAAHQRAGHARQLGTRVSCARAPWVRLAGTHRRLDESSMPLEPCARGHGDHAGTAVPAERASRALRRAALCGHCKEERAEPAGLLQGYPATPSRFPHPYPYATPTPRWTLLSVPSHLPPAARNRARSLRRQSHHVAHPAPDEDPAARLAAASITLRVHARRRRCGSRRARQGDAAHSQAAAATGCPRRRDEAVRGRDVRRRGGHVAPVCRAAGRALVRSSAQREHASSSDGSPRAHA